MRIEHYFYKETVEMYKMIKKDIEQKNQKLSDEERDLQEEMTKKGAEKFIEYGKQRLHATRYIPNGKKIQNFSMLYQKMIDFAEYMSCDIIIESDMETNGKITLQFESMLFDKNTSKTMLPLFMKLLKSADMVWLSSKENIFQLECLFQLADKLYMKSLL